MKKLKQQQVLPISLDEAWDFFATPINLNEVTPQGLDFKITSELPEKMYEGLIITYKIRPMLAIPVNWVTEITHIEEKRYFVDEQRQGPYNIWHHEHHFEQTDNGVLMTDILYYDIGKSIFGWVAGHLFVHRQVEEIFSYRKKALDEYFSKTNRVLI